MEKLDVIIVDDDEVDRYLAIRFLKKNPHVGHIREVDSGYSLIQNARTIFRDISDRYIVLMDINMPRLSGFQTLEKFEQLIADGVIPGNCTVSMYTSSDNPYDHTKSREFSTVKGYIVKPMDQGQATRLVDFCLDGTGDRLYSQFKMAAS